ncbi:MAG: hypothetical protein ACK2U6_05410 [Candidatus Promineifilaceae bacterium]
MGKTSQGFLALIILLLGVPLLITLAWGAYLSESAYAALLASKGLAVDMQTANAGNIVAQSPLYVGLLSALGSYAPQVTLIAGALGWGSTAVVILLAVRAAGRPLAAIIAALLIVFNPLVLTSAGTEISWVLALGWAAVALTALPLPAKWAVWLKVILLLLLLGVHFTAATIVLALTLLAVDVYKGRSSWLPFLFIAGAVLLWGLFAIPRFGSLPAADPLLWLRDGYAFLAGNQLYWFYAFFVLAGLWDVFFSEQYSVFSKQYSVNRELRAVDSGQLRVREMRQMVLLLILWVGTAVLARDPLAPFIITVLRLVLAGVGAAWLARKLLLERADGDRQAALLVPMLVTIPLLLVSLVYLRDLYRTRPLQQIELQDRAAAWLLENSTPEAALFAPPRIGFASERPTLPGLVDRIRDENVGEVYQQLITLTPDFIVSEGNGAWDYVTRTTWFQDRYAPRTQFEDGYAADSPVTVWEYAPSPFDDGQRVDLTAVVDDRFALTGYQFEPQVITPGDDIYLTLYLEVLQPIEQGFITGVHLSAPDGWVWAWREERTPRSLPGQWLEPGQIFPERIRVQTTEDIPLGAYDLQVFWRAGDDKTNWPIVREGDDAETAVFDRIFLGSVIAPAAVDTGQATQVNARFGDAILLDSFELSPSPDPGGPLDVTLFWEALDSPAADYTVFVHLLDGDGQIVTAHDGMPAQDSFPTGAWKPGLVVADTHTLDIPPDLAPGTYQINTGLYLLETGQRLPVLDAAGVEQLDRALPLAEIEIGSEQ